MFNFKAVLAAIAVLACVQQARAEVLLADNFDSYSYDNNLAAFHAAWTPSGSAGGVLLTGSTNKSVITGLSAGARSQRSFPAFTPTTQEDLQISFKIMATSSGFSRQYLELMGGAGSDSGQLLQLGVTDTPFTVEWAVRMLGSVEANTLVPMDPAAPDRIAQQFAEFKAIIHRESDTTASARIYVNNVLGKSLSGFDLRSYDTVRIGSNLPQNILVLFDDVLVQTVPVPEPSTTAVAVITTLALLRRRRRDT